MDNLFRGPLARFIGQKISGIAVDFEGLILEFDGGEWWQIRRALLKKNHDKETQIFCDGIVNLNVFDLLMKHIMAICEEQSDIVSVKLDDNVSLVIDMNQFEPLTIGEKGTTRI